MALLWIEGFEEFGATSGVAPVGLDLKYPDYTSTTNTTIVDGRFGGKAISPFGNAAAGRRLITPDFGNIETWIIGFAMRMADEYPFGLICSLIENTSFGLGLHLTTEGQFRVVLNGISNILATSVGAPIAINSWGYVEFKVTVGNSGSYELRVNEQVVLSDSGVDTQWLSNPYANRVRFDGQRVITAANNWLFDDIYICDDSGSVNNDFLGERHVKTIFPDAAGDSTDFTPSSGDNWAAVDDAAPDGDSTYVQGISADRDLYNCQSAPVTDINGVQINAIARITDASPLDLHLVAKSGTTTNTGSAVAVTAETYSNKHRVVEADPDTTSAWTTSGINTGQFGIEVG